MIGGQAGNRLPKTREISWVVGFLGGALVSHLAQSAGVTYGCHSVLLRRRDRRLCLVARGCCGSCLEYYLHLAYAGLP